MKTMKFTGKTEEEAVRKASDALNVPKEQLEYEVVGRSGGLLGLLGQSVTIEVKVPEGTTDDLLEAPVPSAKSTPIQPLTVEEDEYEDEEFEDEIIEGEEIEPEIETEVEEGEEPEELPLDEEVFKQRMEKAYHVVRELLHMMDCEVNIKVSQKGAQIHVQIEGIGPEWLVGGKGRYTKSSVLDSFQFIVNKIVNRFPPRYKVVIDPAGFREKRQAKLEDLAKRLAQKVKQTGKPLWILPMSAKDRRIMHLALAEMEGVGTKSFGYGASRRMKIFPKSGNSLQRRDRK